MKGIQHIQTGKSHEGLEIINTTKKSGFFDLPKIHQCPHPDHYPPKGILIPKGMGYRHVCPVCGNEINILSADIFL